MSDEHRHDADLDEIPDLDDLPELPELPGVEEASLEEDLPELPEMPDEVELASAAGAVAATATDGEQPPLRELDKAPLHLRKAAMIAVVGSLLPWMGHGGGLVTSVAAKAAVLLGVWLWYLQVRHNWGPRVSGFAGKLAELELRPEKKEEEDPKRAARRASQQQVKALSHPFPTGLHVASLLVILAACAGLPMLDTTAGLDVKIAMAELGMLAWAAYTYVHIFAYERWGHFNPIFPLMFLALVIGGAARMVAGFGLGLNNLEGLSAVAGGGIVAAGGVLAGYTIVEAMMQAKKEGDIKKQAAIEARKAARKSRRSGS